MAELGAILSYDWPVNPFFSWAILIGQKWWENHRSNGPRCCKILLLQSSLIPSFSPSLSNIFHLFHTFSLIPSCFTIFDGSITIFPNGCCFNHHRFTLFLPLISPSESHPFTRAFSEGLPAQRWALFGKVSRAESKWLNSTSDGAPVRNR